MSDPTAVPPVPPAPPIPAPDGAVPGPKPTKPYTVEHNLHVPIEQEEGGYLELVLPLRIGYRKMRALMDRAREEKLDAIAQLLAVMELYGVSPAPVEGAADYADVLATAQFYMDAFQEKALAKLGELEGSSPD